MANKHSKGHVDKVEPARVLMTLTTGKGVGVWCHKCLPLLLFFLNALLGLVVVWVQYDSLSLTICTARQQRLPYHVYIYLSIYIKIGLRVYQILHLFQRAMFVCSPPCPPCSRSLTYYVDFNFIYKTWTLQPYKNTNGPTQTKKKQPTIVEFLFFLFFEYNL